MQGFIKAPDTEGQQIVAAFLFADWSANLTRTNLSRKHYFLDGDDYFFQECLCIWKE